MKLTTRRTVRQWFLDAPRGTVYALYAAAIAVTGLGVFADAASVMVAGIGAFVALFAIRDRVRWDSCPTCNTAVNALSVRYCGTCGTRLDDLEAAPPIDERVDERFRPVGLGDLEREPVRDRPPRAVADGGDQDGHEEDR